MEKVPPAAVVRVSERLRSSLMSARRKMLPPSVASLDFITDLWGFQVTYVLTDLGIFDILKNGPRSADAIARAIGIDEQMLYRLLRAATTLDLVEERDGGIFVLKPMGASLCDDEQSLRDYVLFMGRFGWRTWGRLIDAVRSGRPAIEVETGKGLFDYLDSEPEAHDLFNRAMTAISNVTIGPITRAYDFTRCRRIIDIGGGYGRLLAGILLAAPEARGVLFDLPPVLDGAEAMLREHGVRDRVDVIGGDFFKGVPEGGDCYVLKTIIHDWYDEDALRILKNVRQAIGPSGRLLLCETVVPDRNIKDFAKMLDIEMIVHGCGKERTRQEYADLFEQSGFQLNQVITTASPICVVEGVPVE